jgi:histidyl-tRNA synthetase
MKSQMREANRHEASYVLILGDDELAAGEVTVRPLDDSGQVRVPLAEIVAWLSNRLDS